MRRPIGLLVSCEHASNRLPARYGRLGLSRRLLGSHIAWDPGARELARDLARRLRAAHHEGRYSRLLVDLNRSLGHRGLVAAHSFGVRVPGNAGVGPVERERRVDRYYAPYRARVMHGIGAIVARGGVCLHLSVHSFAPAVNGVSRHTDIGVLYDPARADERRVAAALAAQLHSGGLRVRRNYPYRGTSDGLTASCRAAFPPGRYLGIEIECNQRLLRDRIGQRRLARTLARSLRAVVYGGRQGRG